MRKGFGHYSPHETTVFLLKAVLLSFWIGADAFAVLFFATSPASVVLRNVALFAVVAAVLTSGTVFSALFCWATGSLFGQPPAPSPCTRFERILHCIKLAPILLLSAGAVVVSLLFLGALFYFARLQKEGEFMRNMGRADAAIARQCMEVARLERELFRSDEQLAIAQCLIQYDKQYAALIRQRER